MGEMSIVSEAMVKGNVETVWMLDGLLVVRKHL